MPPKISLIGHKFNRLFVVAESNKRAASGAVMWKCVCDCGTTKIVDSNSLRGGRTRSCGCFNKEQAAARSTIHGECPRSGKSLTYLSWDSMIQRCTNPNSAKFGVYGGAGVVVVKEWLVFENFMRDMGLRPSKLHTLDRFPNPSGDYEPSNCRWATWAEQSRNRRDNVRILYDGKNLVVADWATILKTNANTIQRSLKRGKAFSEIYNFYSSK